MKLLLKRDETGDGHPSPEQVEVGELVMNSITGKLYTKLKDCSIIEFIGQKICFDPTPTVAMYYANNLVVNDILNDYCALGGVIEFQVSGLKLSPEEYDFSLVELTSNTLTGDIILQTPKYETYTTPKPGTTTNETITLRKASVPSQVSLTNGQGTVSIFKFTVLSTTNNNKKLVEKIVTIKCLTA